LNEEEPKEDTSSLERGHLARFGACGDESAQQGRIADSLTARNLEQDAPWTA
jgi:hypothetical protein